VTVPKEQPTQCPRWRPEVVTEMPTPTPPIAAADGDRSDRAARLKEAAAPVLDELVTQLRDSSLCVTLADHDSLIVETRTTDDRLRPADWTGAAPDGVFTEPTPIPSTGAGQPDERVICYVQSIQHPLTGDVEGALVVSGAMPQANPLFLPYLRHAVKDITQRLMDGSHEERLVLAWFQEAARDRSRAVVVMSDQLVLTTPAAADLLWPADHASLRRLVRDVPVDGGLTRTLELTSGMTANVEAFRMTGAPGVLFRLSGRSRRGGGFHVEERLRRLRGTHCPVVISGEPGTGRTRAVGVVAGTGPVATLHAAEVPACGEGAWARRLRELAADTDGVIAVEEIQLLPATLCVQLSALLAESSASFVLTSTPQEDLPPHAATLAFNCMYRIELPPLRRRRDELPALARAMAREAGHGRDLNVGKSALVALAGHQWQGNLRELAMVVRHAAAARGSGEITAADLPEVYRIPASTRPLTRWQQAEHDAIVSALQATAGNKVQAAGRLGISRTTLYNRIRALKITV
jgi:sigma-54 dependent transcriptional regulator, acetoin dehydrogenase operon transcriptional activator AcoR